MQKRRAGSLDNWSRGQSRRLVAGPSFATKLFRPPDIARPVAFSIAPRCDSSLYLDVTILIIVVACPVISIRPCVRQSLPESNFSSLRRQLQRTSLSCNCLLHLQPRRTQWTPYLLTRHNSEATLAFFPTPVNALFVICPRGASRFSFSRSLVWSRVMYARLRKVCVYLEAHCPNRRTSARTASFHHMPLFRAFQ